MKTVIVGAGLTGLILADQLSRNSPKEIGSSISIIEKSRGVGGRMATRRTVTAKFDHGGQFYARRIPLEGYHQKWMVGGLTHHWFERDKIQHYNAPGGLTTLAKDLAKGLDIQFEKKLLSVKPSGAGWRLELEPAEELFCDRLILTAPLPQSLEILRQSSIVYGVTLDQIHYSKALVALLEVNVPSERLGGERGYVEFTQGPLFSIADQLRKNVSNVPAYTVTLSAEYSGKMYEYQDEVIAEMVGNEIARLDPTTVIHFTQIKRWRYARPLSTYESLFCEITPSLFLAGDAFGGGSFNGATRSAMKLSEDII